MEKIKKRVEALWQEERVPIFLRNQSVDEISKTIINWSKENDLFPLSRSKISQFWLDEYRISYIYSLKKSIQDKLLKAENKAYEESQQEYEKFYEDELNRQKEMIPQIAIEIKN